ncbi:MULTISPECIES: RNA polymerase sigma factor [Sphingobacterium]|uniref:RNA polymerase sigma factor n=1 Tax=Sphingobacterium TaxID=28453 RepID=UPI000DB3B32F|nr:MULTISPECIES: RNA polymerase sigma-70 factor [Sphingobacterium]PZU09501.1 MAG: hypothetical protein DI622_16455 [Chryseobacterium sp.]
MKPVEKPYEELLLQRLHNGNQTAFNELFRMFHPALIFFSKRLLYNTGLDESEEIVQDVFIKFYDRKESFSSIEKIRAFLYITTKNACFDYIAKEQVRIRRYNKFVQNFNEEDESSIVREIIYAEVLREVSQAIETLPTKCREVMQRFFVYGMDAKEIAEELGITVSTVNNQKARAISILQKGLSGAGITLLLATL